jgi:hypothetical protein
MAQVPVPPGDPNQIPAALGPVPPHHQAGQQNQPPAVQLPQNQQAAGQPHLPPVAPPNPVAGPNVNPQVVGLPNQPPAAVALPDANPNAADEVNWW